MGNLILESTGVIMLLMLKMATRTAYGFFHLLGWKFVFFLSALAAKLIYAADRKLRAITVSELAALYGGRKSEREIRELAKRTIEHYYARLVETFFFGALDKKRLEEIMRPEGMEHLDKALARGKGVILLISHFGSFLLPLPFLGYRGYTVNQITGKQLHSSPVTRRIWAWRKKESERLPVNFIQVDKFLRPLYQALGKNEIVALAFDGRDGSKWVTVDFYGRKALFSAGPFDLARRTGATIIPAFVVRKADRTHSLVFEPPFLLSEARDREKALGDDTARFVGLMLRYIDAYPCHFAWILFKIRKLEKAGIDYAPALFQDA